MNKFEKIVWCAVCALGLVVAYAAYAEYEARYGYWSQFRCEGDCEAGSGCPYCDGE